ncbi:MAG TPA: DUF3341 domain-containing protein [Thermoanaerobaculia bacterium]|nr:DUF3341 domain-containing protein [Thermoanaerobaculia bacterium]HUM30112.1 DUF3341 domain-containing protein [Thermoanaerobaculia bacterium]HXK68809.1 DUF3341 domain-containing protein [Thermoanaerobaculia bacterium]
MNHEWTFDDQEAFVEKLNELVQDGCTEDDLEIITPFPVHGLEETLKERPSFLKFFSLAGSLAGLLAGFAFTIYTVLSWPLITGGKPLISITAFVVIAFELTILIGAITTFIGFLILGRFPSLPGILQPRESGNRFIIIDRRRASA